MKVFPHETVYALGIISMMTPSARHTLKVLSRPFGCISKLDILYTMHIALPFHLHIYNSEAPTLSTTGLV